MTTNVKMFDERGTCKYCEKQTRAKATSICNACYRLDLAITNNLQAAQKILREREKEAREKRRKELKEKLDQQLPNPYYEGLDHPIFDPYYVPDSRYKNPYRNIRPKEEQ